MTPKPESSSVYSHSAVLNVATELESERTLLRRKGCDLLKVTVAASVASTEEVSLGSDPHTNDVDNIDEYYNDCNHGNNYYDGDDDVEDLTPHQGFYSISNSFHMDIIPLADRSPCSNTDGRLGATSKAVSLLRRGNVPIPPSRKNQSHLMKTTMTTPTHGRNSDIDSFHAPPQRDLFARSLNRCGADSDVVQLRQKRTESPIICSENDEDSIPLAGSLICGECQHYIIQPQIRALESLGQNKNSWDEDATNVASILLGCRVSAVVLQDFMTQQSNGHKRTPFESTARTLFLADEKRSFAPSANSASIHLVPLH